jgi:Na+-transporting methylmalonyl-CoA/oxaloacetate decarboxylase gamma subunit
MTQLDWMVILLGIAMVFMVLSIAEMRKIRSRRP